MLEKAFPLILPSSLFCVRKKKAIMKATVKKLKEIADLLNANIVHNANGLSSERNPEDVENIEWIAGDKKRLLHKKFKMTYGFRRDVVTD